jgi:hypothetical protein
LILNSKTWKMASVGKESSNAKDPENRYLHRQNLRRVDAEVLRDSLLATSSRLDRTMLGECVLTFISPNATSIRPEMIPPSGPENGQYRRSIYILVRRKHFDPLLQAFDLPDPSNSTGRRSESMVAPQALAMMNNQFITELATDLGEEVSRWSGTVSDKLDRLFIQLLGRRSSESERKLLLPLCPGDQSSSEAWSDVIHVLWNSVDFQFVN